MLKLHKLAKRILRCGKKRPPTAAAFAGGGPYWEKRYAEGGTSGAGSAGQLAEFKARVLNEFVEQRGVKTVLELGCGDGSQLALARYPSYVGVDVSQTAVDLCRRRFAGDASKRFVHASERHLYEGSYDLVLSLDVIFHLVEDAIYEAYMADLQQYAGKYIVIYSSNYDDDPEMPWALHVRHRKFSDFFANLRNDWQLSHKIDNPYPYESADPDSTSFADFYIYHRTSSSALEQQRP
jgi:SAM-dependent methyltransferase